jgi:uncharacterized repeat protein (TIGR01451 family)
MIRQPARSQSRRFRLCPPVLVLLCALALPLSALAAPGVYDFEDLPLGNISNGQDGWYMPNGNTLEVIRETSGVNTSKVMHSNPAPFGEQFPCRYSNSNFTFAAFSSNETFGVYQMDVRYSNTTSSAGLRAMAADRLNYKPGFGINNWGYLYLNDASWDGYDLVLNPPALTLDNGDWIRLRMVIDFTANNYEGSAVLYGLNLTDGQTNFSPLVVNNNLYIRTNAGNEADPLLWTNLWFRFDLDPMRVDNIQIGESDLALAAAAAPDPLFATNVLTYTLTVTNRGPTEADTVVLTDLIPTNLSLVSVVCSQGAWVHTNGIITCNFGRMTNGGVATVSVVMSNLLAAVFTNRASVLSRCADPNTNNNATALQTTALLTMTVSCAWGAASPLPGTYAYTGGSTITNSVSTPDERGTTQYVCSGWTMTGNAPLTGTNSSFVTTLTNSAALTWLWTTNFYFSRTEGPNGHVAGPSNGWCALGGSVTVTAVPNAYYHFDSWTGSVEGAAAHTNPLALTMNCAKSLSAAFAENLATNHGTPEWWLAGYGLTNNFNLEEMRDMDGDGLLAWEECVAGTVPTNRASVLKVVQINCVTGIPPVIRWSTAAARLYSVECATNQFATNKFFLLTTNLPDSISVYTDTVTRTPPVFYRVRVTQ